MNPPTNQDNEHLDVFTRGETYQPPTHDQKRVDQVKRIMEKQKQRAEIETGATP